MLDAYLSAVLKSGSIVIKIYFCKLCIFEAEELVNTNE